MKHFCKVIILFVSFFSIAAPNYGQNYADYSSGSVERIQRTTYSNSSIENYDVSSYAFGYGSSYYQNNGDPYTEFREVATFIKFDLSFLPSDAYNIQATLRIYRVSGNGNSDFLLLTDNVAPNDEAKFNAVLDGAYLFNVDHSNDVFHNVTSNVIAKKGQGYINYGVKRDGTYYGNISTDLLVEWDAPSHITAKNIFTYGSINVDGGSTETSPHTFTKNVGTTLSLEAIDQTYNGYYWLWNDIEAPSNKSDWNKWVGTTPQYKSSSKFYSFSVNTNDNGASYVAGLRKRCNLTFTNSTGAGTIKVDGVLKTSLPFSTTEIEKNDITGLAIKHFSNGIEFTFSSWSPGGSTSYETTFAPEVHTNYVANFTGSPTNTYRNQRFNTKVVGQPIKVYWDQHPNTSVTQYKVYRKPKYGSESCVGTFARTGTSSYVYTFTDPDMVHTNSSSSYDLYYYDVRAYYSPDGTYSDYDFKAVYAEMGGPIADDSPKEERMQIAEKIYEYGISNYPNPYNPTTTISYSIKEQGNVQITVYDALGRKVADLVNEIKQPGSYAAMFNGSNLTSGIYFYTMKVNDFMETKKMLLTK